MTDQLIPERYRSRVFGMFQTLKPRDEVEGSGMGLAIVKKLVERQGGMIWLTEGQGGVGLSGPLYLASASERVIMSPTVNLLLVEDDEVDIQGLKRAFASRIANPITVARDGIEALELLRTAKMAGERCRTSIWSARL